MEYWSVRVLECWSVGVLDGRLLILTLHFFVIIPDPIAIG